MPRSPSRKVIALSVEAVFMKAGSRVTRPVLARRLVMSMPRSPSVPSTTSRSSSCLPALTRKVSGTASLLWRLACAHALSRGAGKESRAQAPEQSAQFGRRSAEIIGPGQGCMLPEAPGHGADANARRPAGCEIDRAVAHQQRPPGRDAEPCAQGEQTVRLRFSGGLVAAEHRAERALHPEPPEDLPGESARFVGEDRPLRRRGAEHLRDPVGEAGG